MPSKLIELEIARPGVFGVNTSASGDIMPKEYSTQADNFVFSDEGYLEARRGSRRTHASAVTGTVRQIFDTRDENGAELVLFSTATKIYRKTGGAPVDITGTITAPTSGNWKFVNLNNEIYATQEGHTMIKLATPSSGTFVNAVPTGTAAPTPANIVDTISAFGRLWHLSDDRLTYSSLLLPENYDSITSDAGYFDLHATYLKGDETPVALAEFNGNLLVFTANHVTVWVNPWNPNGTGGDYGGLSTPAITDPYMQVIETIGGVGCVARDSIQYTQNDILFLSEQGVTSLSRVVQEKSMPVQRHSDNVRKEILNLIRGQDTSNIWSTYVEAKGVYIVGSPDAAQCFVIDVSGQLPDGSFRALTWSKVIYQMQTIPETQLNASDDSWAAVLISDEASYLSQCKGYDDYTPDNGVGGSPFLLTYESAWSSIVEDFENYLKFPKRLGVVVKGTGATSFSINLAFDYGSFIDSLARVATLDLTSPSTYGTAQYNVDTYGGALRIDEAQFMGFGAGRIMKVRVITEVNGEPISVQRVSIRSKIGKQS